MKPITFSTRRPSQSILKFILVVVISSIVPLVAMAAGKSISRNENPPAMRLTGIVSDTMCGGIHGTTRQGDAECTRVCVKFGAEYALVVGHKIYTLRGDQAELNTFAGHMVVVRGSILNRNTIAVESVAPYTVWAFWKK
jgi:hypothetical protein